MVGKVVVEGVVAFVANGAVEWRVLIHRHLATPHAGVGKSHTRLMFKLSSAALALYSINHAHSLPLLLVAKGHNGQYGNIVAIIRALFVDAHLTSLFALWHAEYLLIVVVTALFGHKYHPHTNE